MQFKKGDIICSDRFRSGLLLFVEENAKKRWINKIFATAELDQEFYSCTSLLNPKQTWCAYDQYNFRIATHEDIAKQLASYIKASEIISSDLTLDIDDDLIILDDGYDHFVTLTPQEAITLRDIIDTYVEG